MHRTPRTSLILSVFFAALAAAGCESGPAAYDDGADLRSPTEVSAVVTSCDLAYVVEDPSCVTLYAGQHIDVGSVCTAIAGDDLVVTYSTVNGWELTGAHLWIGDDLADMPKTSTGNPKIGNFPYNAGDLDGVTSHSFSVPLSSIDGGACLCDATYFLAAHAVVRAPDGQGGWDTQTAWGDGPEVNPGGSWATYFDVTLGCEEEPPGEPEVACETAFAFGETTFIDLGLTDSRWGWEVGPFAPGSYSTPIYAGAAQNDIEKGTEVGALGYEYDGYSVTVTFTTLPGVTMEETHLYVGSTPTTTISPGQLGHLHDLDGASSDSFTVGVFRGEPLYLVAHAVTCF